MGAAVAVEKQLALFTHREDGRMFVEGKTFAAAFGNILYSAQRALFVRHLFVVPLFALQGVDGS